MILLINITNNDNNKTIAIFPNNDNINSSNNRQPRPSRRQPHYI